MSQPQTQIPSQPQSPRLHANSPIPDLHPHDPINTLKKQSLKTSLKNISSFTNLYNSTSNTGSNASLSLSNPDLFNNNAGIVHQGTITHIDNSNTHYNYYYGNDEDNDSAFELNWTPQVSSDNYTSGYHEKF